MIFIGVRCAPANPVPVPFGGTGDGTGLARGCANPVPDGVGRGWDGVSGAMTQRSDLRISKRASLTPSMILNRGACRSWDGDANRL